MIIKNIYKNTWYTKLFRIKIIDNIVIYPENDCILVIKNDNYKGYCKTMIFCSDINELKYLHIFEEKN